MDLDFERYAPDRLPLDNSGGTTESTIQVMMATSTTTATQTSTSGAVSGCVRHGRPAQPQRSPTDDSEPVANSVPLTTEPTPTLPAVVRATARVAHALAKPAPTPAPTPASDPDAKPETRRRRRRQVVEMSDGEMSDRRRRMLRARKLLDDINAVQLPEACPVYDDCDTIRAKLTQLFDADVINKSDWLSHFQVNANSLRTFAIRNGSLDGHTQGIYEVAYWFFERCRIFQDNPKSPRRLQNEQDHPQGFPHAPFYLRVVKPKKKRRKGELETNEMKPSSPTSATGSEQDPISATCSEQEDQPHDDDEG